MCCVKVNAAWDTPDGAVRHRWLESQVKPPAWGEFRHPLLQIIPITWCKLLYQLTGTRKQTYAERWALSWHLCRVRLLYRLTLILKNPRWEDWGARRRPQGQKGFKNNINNREHALRREGPQGKGPANQDMEKVIKSCGTHSNLMHRGEEMLFRPNTVQVCQEERVSDKTS